MLHDASPPSWKARRPHWASHHAWWQHLSRLRHLRSCHKRYLIPRLLLSGLLALLLFSQIAGHASAAVGFFAAPLPAATGGHFRLQDYFKQTHPYQASATSPMIPPLSQVTPPPGGTNDKKANTKPLPSAEPAKMKPVSQKLSTSFLAASPSVPSSIGNVGNTGLAPVSLSGSDTGGIRLEVIIPVGALDLSQASTEQGGKPQGDLTVTLSQVHGHFVGTTNVLGAFHLQITDAAGHVVHHLRLRTPVTFLYHYRPKEVLNLSMDPTHLFMTWPDLLEAAQMTRSVAPSDDSYVIRMQDDPTTSTLMAQSIVLDSSVIALGVGDPQNQSPPTPHLASVSGNSGQLSYSYPLAVAPGPPGTTPSLAVIYSSSSTNGRTSPRSPAGSVGEGWSLAMGSISAEKYPDGSVWYSISGVDNVSDRLVPDSSGNNFATEHLSYLKITRVDAGFDSQKCFHVWDTGGAYYEFGCTRDSMQ
jgi:hypothetical protein